MALVQTDESPARRFFRRLACPEWPAGNNRPTTALYVHGQDAGGAMGDSESYLWSAYDAERVGINPKMLGLQASCSLVD